MPLARHNTRPKLVDRDIVAVKIYTFFSAIFSAPMTLVIEGSDTNSPNPGPSENRNCQRVATDPEKHSVPKRPVKGKVKNGPCRVTKRSPLLVLLVTVKMHSGVAEH